MMGIRNWKVPKRRLSACEIQIVLQELERVFVFEAQMLSDDHEAYFPNGKETIREFCSYFGDTDDIISCIPIIRPAWKAAAIRLNSTFDLAFTLEQWRPILKDSKHKSVTVLFEFLSKYVEIESIEPLRILNRECREAGAFLALRQSLGRLGIDVNDLRPSSSLTSAMSQGLGTIVFTALRMAPRSIHGRINTQQVKQNYWDITCLIVASLSVFVLPVLWVMTFIQYSNALLFATLVSSVVGISTYIFGRRIDTGFMAYQELDDFKTVADVCRAMVCASSIKYPATPAPQLYLAD